MCGGDPAICSHRGLSSSLRSEACSALGGSDEVIHSAGGDAAVCSQRVEAVHSIQRRGYRAAETQQFAFIGSRCSLQSKAWLVRGGDPAVCSHGVEQFTALRDLASGRRRSSSLLS